MGYMLLTFRCIACGAPDAGNPNKVPSIRVSMCDGRAVADPNGTREPLCRRCAERVNENRTAAGLPPVVIAPDAYEAADEHDL